MEWKQDNQHRPFCCARCKLIDLGEWASGERRIASEPTGPQDESSLDTSLRDNDSPLH